jgi:hypothetical protein
MRAARIDANQPEIVAALRAVGAKVQCLQAVGQGFPDILALFCGEIYLLEIKAPGGKLTADERRWHDAWGCAAVVRSVDEALAAIGAIGEGGEQ